MKEKVSKFNPVTTILVSFVVFVSSLIYIHNITIPGPHEDGFVRVELDKKVGLLEKVRTFLKGENIDNESNSTSPSDSVWVKFNSLKSDSTISHKQKDKYLSVDSFKYSKLYFHLNPQLLIWSLMISILLSVASGLGFINFHQISIIHQMNNLRFKEHITTGIITLFFALVLVPSVLMNSNLNTPFEIMQKFHIILKHPHFMWISVVLAFILVLFPLYGHFLASKSLLRLDFRTKNEERHTKYNPLARARIKRRALMRSMRFKEMDQEEIETRDAHPGVEKFSSLYKSVKFFLVSLAILIGLTLITTYSIRQVIMTEIQIKKFDIYPIEFVYMFSLYFTLVLAILYLPVHFQFKEVGKSVLNDPTIEMYLHKKDKEKLELKQTTFENVKTTLSILSPLISTFLYEVFRVQF